MSTPVEPRLREDELRQLLQAADPAALLVHERLVRRIIKRDRKLVGIGLEVPHRKSYIIGREALLALCTRAELEVEANRELPATLLLFARPRPEKLAIVSREAVLVTYWRRLFHAHIHLAISQHQLTDAAIRKRIHDIGRTAFDEIRAVLRQEKFLLPPGDDRTAYEEFAALYLELSYFAPTLLPHYFPTIDDFTRIDQILLQDADAPALFAATRLKGAPDPVIRVNAPGQAEMPDLEEYGGLLTSANRAAEAGNVVRAAILLVQSIDASPPELARDLHDRAQDELDRLVERLQQALELNDQKAEAWRRTLPLLLPRAAAGYWPPEARLLYDLQKICVDHERPVSAPEFVAWVYSRFRQPLVRVLPYQSLVQAVKHLRTAISRLPSVRVGDAERHALLSLLRSAVHAAEVRLRERFRPVLQEALHQAGLWVNNFPEQVSHDKLVEELLDRVTERGFVNMADLRDALSRNELKLSDLSGPREFFGGDALLCANRELAVQTPGVYRRGEVYLRFLQRGSALAFGTPLGRWLTLFLMLPFGVAFGTVIFAQEMVHLVHKADHFLHGVHEAEKEPHTISPLEPTIGIPTLLLGIFYLLLLHVPAFRDLLWRGLHATWLAGWRLGHFILFDLPATLMQWSMVRWFLDSHPFLLFARYILKPLPFAAVAVAILWGTGFDPAITTAGGIAVLLAVNLFLGSPWGQDVEAAVIEYAIRRWEFYRNLLPGVVRLFLDIFKTILEGIDRFLYTVDEWLRFRPSEGRLTRVLKSVLGFVWFGVTYIVRLFVNVFIEPTVNPVKHIPAVTIAAKLLMPLWPTLTPWFAKPFEVLGLNRWLAYTIAQLPLHSLPGAAGFLVWELTANWRLYRANRPTVLRPTVVGHHGETMLQLMKPGFHSGTLPKLYTKLRQAERRAHQGGAWRFSSVAKARRLRETLHEVEVSIRHFAERELLAFVNGCKGWTAGPVQLAGVQASSNRIRLELSHPLNADNLVLEFEERSGWLLAGMARPGWLGQLSNGQTSLLVMALTGFYKKAGVDLIREQIEASFGPECPPYDIAEEGIVLWPGEGYETEVIYNLSVGPQIQPRIVTGPAIELPVLETQHLLFSSQEVTWMSWVQAWQQAEAGAAEQVTLLPGVRVLPAWATVS